MLLDEWPNGFMVSSALRLSPARERRTQEQGLLLNVEETAYPPERQGIRKRTARKILVELLPVNANSIADFGNGIILCALAAQILSEFRID